MLTQSSSSLSSIYPWKYDIFLSFCGKDTRKSFTDHLYGALKRYRIITFRDDNNLERGEDIAPELSKAIGVSWGSIIVFSKGYTFSSWCLDELAEIVKQRKERGHKVFPIFYDVEASHLRKYKYNVQEAFAKHEGRYDKKNKEKMQRWRDALFEVANISGWPLNDKYELNLIENVVEEIATKLAQTCSHLKELYSKLSIGQDDVRMIGICGIGGTGKTTLARVVYTQMSPHFETKSFLADVGEFSRKNELVSLQRQLLSQILPEENSFFSSIHEGNDIISHKLAQKKVLIVMDDVDNIQHLKCMVGRREWFGSGSRIIITTRDEQLLQSFGVDDVCKLITLDASSPGLAAMNFDSKIHEFWDTLIDLDEKMNDLKRKLEGLNGLREDTKSRLSTELHPRKKLKKEVELWLRNVERINGEIQDLQQKYGESSVSSRGFRKGNVFKKIQEVEELLQQGKFHDSLVVDNLRWIGQALSTTTLFGGAPKICMEEIWAYLMDNNIQKIGVWGMGGVGKTSIMKLINNQLLKETENFDIVIWITVSKEMNIKKLQNSIARAMKVTLHEEDEVITRAGMIYEMLALKGRYVIILDDLWDNFSLEEVGIPEPSNGSKLVVTTRILNVCRYFDCQEVRLRTLLKQDALSLFLEKAGRDVLNYPELLPIVELVAEKCGGLPLAIVTIASSMKGVRDICEWRNALHELNRHVESVNGIEDKVFLQLQFSYDRLEDEKVKHCFLCCALYPEDCEIDKNQLIKLWIVEGFVEEMYSMQMEIDKGHTILNKLKSCCLIENGTKFPNKVKLHDVVRDMALRITSARPRFLVRAGMKLKEIPNVQEWNEDLEKVSLMENWELQIPPQMLLPKCQQLTTLLLSSCNIKSFPECFFEQMHGLKILDLSNNYEIKSLPNSIANLETLTALLLGWCVKLEKVPSFSKLLALKKLDLGHTDIKDLPHGMEMLVNLKYLDLSETSISTVADGILAKFTLLQHLAINNFVNYVCRFVKEKDISGLRKLEFFQGRFYDLNEWNSYIQTLLAIAKGPRQYYICVGDRQAFEGSCYNVEKFIEINGCNICTNGIKVPSNVEALNIVYCFVELCGEKAFFSWFILVAHNIFSSLSQLKIINCKNIKKLFSSSWVLQKNLQNLNILCVRNCEDMEEIIASESELVEEGIGPIKLTFPKLRELELRYLPELKSICSVNEVMVCDSVECICIENCPKLKRMPLILPLLGDDQPYPPFPLTRIIIRPEEQWELVEWDQPNANSQLERFVW